MKKPLQHSLWATSAVLVLFTCGSAHATNGYFSHGYGTKSKGMVGAGVAYVNDSMAAATNPAGMVHAGNRFDGGLAWFHPEREYTVSGGTTNSDIDGDGVPDFFTFPLNPTTTQSGSTDFFIPHIGFNKMLTSNMSAGLTVYGNGGMNTDYPNFPNTLFCTNPFTGQPIGSQTGSFCGRDAGVDLSQLFVAATFGHKIPLAAGTFSYGISPIFAYQRFSAKGISTFAPLSSDPAHLSANGHDDSSGFGVKVGVMADVGAGVSLGASYQSKFDMDEFDEYAGLFAEQGDFDIPSTWTVGLAWKPAANHAVVLDYQRINYTDVDSISNPISNLLTQCQPGVGGPGCFGASNGAGFGWEDMDVIKLGYEFSVASLPAWTWRLGFSHGEQPIPDSEVTLNIFAPAVIEDHVTFGFTKTVGSNLEFSFASMYALHNSVKGTHAFDPAQQVELEMDQLELEGSIGWKF